MRSDRRILRGFLSGLAAFFSAWTFASPALASDGAPNCPVLGVLPFVPATGGLPRGASASVRDILASEISRRAQSEKSGLGVRAVLFSSALQSSGGASEGSRTCPLSGDFSGGVSPAEADSASEIALRCADEAVSLSRRGRDREAKDAVRQAVLLSPASELAWEGRSETFARLATEVRLSQRASSGKAGALAVISPVGGLEISVDGVRIGTSPAVVSGLLPGIHHVRGTSAALGQSDTRLVEIAQGARPLSVRLIPGAAEESRLSGQDARLGGLSSFLASVGSGVLDAEAVRIGRALAGQEGVSHLIGGILVKRSDAIALVGFIFDAGRGVFTSLPEASFDGELLAAGREARRFVAAFLPDTASACSQNGAFAGEAIAALNVPPSQEASRIAFAERLPAFRPHEKAQTEAQEERRENRPPASDGDGRSVRRPVDSRKAAGALRDRGR